MLADITQVLPGQIFTERSGDHAFLFQFFLRNIGPGHHVKDQLLHINDRRNEVCSMDHLIDPGVHTEKCADTVGDQIDTVIFSIQLCDRLPDFLPGFPWRRGLII